MLQLWHLHYLEEAIRAQVGDGEELAEKGTFRVFPCTDEEAARGIRGGALRRAAYLAPGVRHG